MAVLFRVELQHRNPVFWPSVRRALAFDWALGEGRLVGLFLDALEDAAALLPDGERDLAWQMGPRRRRQFAAGRLALRAAAWREGVALPAVPPSPGGAPRLPRGIAGSISHGGRLAVAMVRTHGDAETRIGVDVEPIAPERPGIARFVLSPEELRCPPRGPAGHAAGRATQAPSWRAVLRAFSAKEAAYKAWAAGAAGARRAPFDPTAWTLHWHAPDAGAGTARLRAPAGPAQAHVSWRTVAGHGLAWAVLSRPSAPRDSRRGLATGSLCEARQ